MADDNESVLAWGAKVVADRVKKVGESIKKDLTSGSGPAIGREMINNIRGTMHQVFFSQGEAVSEPGTPMSPLQSEVAEQRKEDGGSVYGKDSVHGGKAVDPKRLPSPAEVAREKRLYRATDDGVLKTAAVEPESFTERLLRERRKPDEDATGNDERAKGRSLPDEQREREKGRGR